MSTTPSPEAPPALWKSPWVWAFVLGMVVLPWFRPVFSRVAAPPPDLGLAPSDAGGQGVITLAVWCGEAGRCTSAQGRAVLKTAVLMEQAGHAVEWRVYRVRDDKFGRQLERWCAAREGRCVGGPESGDAMERLSSGLRVQRGLRHELVHTASELWGSLSLIDRQERIRGVFHASDAHARREIAHRVESLFRETREGSK
ncbi:MAG: hypothetical protein KGO50_10270 [Myxococcales bacterium]|nr:hypothetical protein [Myxococcales bacterium]